MSWGNSGWDDTDPNESKGGGGNDFYKYAPRRFYTRQGTTRRALFLETTPFRFYEHSMYKITGESRDRCICLAKNQLDERGCPCCDKEAYSYRICYFSVIDMGQVTYGDDGQATLQGWKSKKGVLYQHERQALGAKVGGKDRPGMLQEIKRQMQRQGGDITGCVYDFTRSGKMVETIGDRMEFIERIDRSQWVNYLNKQGANHPDRSVEGKPRPLELDPFEWMAVMKPHSYEQLQALCGGPPKQETQGSGARTEGAGYGGSGSGQSSAGGFPGTPEDDIPFAKPHIAL